MLLYGCPVTADDASWLVAELYADAHDDAVGAAFAIEQGVAGEVEALALSEAQRDAILSVLEDPPDGLLELRGRLLQQMTG